MNDKLFVQTIPEGTDAAFCVDGVNFAILQPDDETAESILKEAEGWVLRKFSEWFYEDLSYNQTKKERTPSLPPPDGHGQHEGRPLFHGRYICCQIPVCQFVSNASLQ